MEFETDNLQSSASNCTRVSGHTPMHCLPQRVKKRMSKQENQQSPLKQLTNNPHQSHQSSPQESGTFLRKRLPRLQAVPAESHCHRGVHGRRTNSIMTLRWVYLLSWARQGCSHLLIMAHVPVPHFICFVQQPRPQHSAGARINTLKFHPNFRNYRTTQTNQHIICHKSTDNTRLTSVSSKSLQGLQNSIQETWCWCAWLSQLDGTVEMQHALEWLPHFPCSSYTWCISSAMI